MRTIADKACLTTVLAAALALSGCAKEAEIKSASELYRDAVELETAADYTGAVGLYNQVQTNFPFGPYAQQSLLNLAHLHYNEAQYEEALQSIDRFLSEYPTHSRLDYARYLKGLILERSKPALIDKLLFDDSANRSKIAASEALAQYQELVEKHPLSIYVPDATARINEIVDKLAQIELDTAIHYMRIGACGATIRRVSDLIVRFPNSHVLEPSMAVLVACTVEMQADTALADASNALRESYPRTTYLEPALAGSGALLDHMGIEAERNDWFTSLID